jgi:hypothetical protein
MWVVERSGSFTPKERPPVTILVSDWIGSWARLDALEKKQISYFCQKLNIIVDTNISVQGIKFNIELHSINSRNILFDTFDSKTCLYYIY